ncbi:MAG TPA: patatin-like phospholipase family protein [Vicinamibacterales bacterium]|nr:patatin-like phospholipase family protein [Vicinamibacterales bacterium]
MALCVEGGAMRGVISAGMVWALEHLGLTTAFDAVYGSSAGAINAAYFLAGQAQIGTTIYYEDINNRRFINLWRAANGRPIVDLGYLIDEVAVRLKPLDVARVLAAQSPLSVMATDAATGQRAILRDFTSARDLLDALRAGATMPIVAGLPATYGAGRYFDASLTEPIPVPTAEAEGHTHILALLTRPGVMRRRPSSFDRLFVVPRLRKLSPALATQYLNRATPYSALIACLDNGKGPRGQASVVCIRAPIIIPKLECSREMLVEGAKRGFASVMSVFET